MKPRFFRNQSEFAKWLEKNHDRATEVWVGYYKKKSGRKGITWPESVEVALRFGWIDSVRRGINEDSYTNRFTPRRPGSNWSAVNIKKAQELIELGLMHPAGKKAFEARTDARSGVYSYEQRHAAKLDGEQERSFRRNNKAWEFFQSRSPSYRTSAIYWVTTAKKEETRKRRLATLIECSAKSETVPPLTPRRRGTD